jgi:hypothetical protein
MQKKMRLEIGCFLTILLAVTPAGAEKSLSPAELVAVTGEVEILRAGTETWQPASSGQKVESGDRVRTAGDASAGVQLGDGSSVQIEPGSEFSVQTVLRDSATGDVEYVFGFTKGKVTAQVNPITDNSVFKIQTPVTTINIPRGAVDPTLPIAFNPDGSMTVTSTEGPFELTGEGDISYTATLETGETALLEYNTETGELRITSVNGTFEVIGPDGKTYVLNTGDTIALTKGAATFIPLGGPLGNPPPGGSVFEPSSADADGGAASSLEAAASGG